MRRAVWSGPGEIRLEEFEPRSVERGDCVVRVSTVAVCSLDARHYRGESTRLRLGQPPVLGHEIFGRIQVPGASGLQEGAPVAVIGSDPCGSCHHCELDLPLLCSDFGISAGGFADTVVIPRARCAWRLLPVPPDTDDVAAAYADSIACAVRAMSKARVTTGERVFVVGGGFMGALVGLLAAAAGAVPTVVTARPVEMAGYGLTGVEFRDAADDLASDSADACILLRRPGRSFDMVPRVLRHGGRVVILGGDLPGAFHRLGDVYSRRLSIDHSFHSGPADRTVAVRSLPFLTGPIRRMSTGVSPSQLKQALEDVADRSLLRCHVAWRA